ncbi:uncharacterized protein LOC135202309 isoform X3 [Macrobrachium nipponense]|uniref:uncharacterized protein LOC135202309 isoform X3 n=1 Tax=Macrobrachium nipponense TaxID=159736 RepID=UPI0030C84AD3
MQTAYARMVYERQAREQRRGAAEGHRQTSTFKTILKDACRRLIAFLFTQVGVCGLVVAYNILGAFAFRVIEGEMGDPRPEETAKELREQMVHRLWNVTLRLNVLEETQWREEVVVALQEYQEFVVPLIKTKGYRGVYPKETWSFSAALMYSLSVYTTIGYGNLAPRTELGKITTILYAIVGMPLMLLYMSNVGEILANIFKFIYFRACRCDIGSLGYYRTASGTIRPVTVSQNVRMNGQAGGASKVPGKTVEGENDDQEVESQQIICTVYLLVGSALVAMCFNLMQEETIENLKAFWRNLGCLRKKKTRKISVQDGHERTARYDGDG